MSESDFTEFECCNDNRVSSTNCSGWSSVDNNSKIIYCKESGLRIHYNCSGGVRSGQHTCIFHIGAKQQQQQSQQHHGGSSSNSNGKLCYCLKNFLHNN